MPLTLDSLLNHLDEDLTWRKREITKLLFLHNEDNSLIVIKSSILLLYSHWEGYIKNSCKQYLIYISDKNIKVSNLTKNFEAIALKGMVNEVYSSKDTLTLLNEIKLLEKIEIGTHKKFNVPQDIIEEKNKDFINTKDNLSLKVFNSFLNIVGIGTIPIIPTRDKYIDEELLNQRNAISHGSKVDPNSIEFNLELTDIMVLKDFIFLLMDHVKDELLTYSENEYYLKVNSELTTQRQLARTEHLTNKMKQLFGIED